MRGNPVRKCNVTAKERREGEGGRRESEREGERKGGRQQQHTLNASRSH